MKIVFISGPFRAKTPWGIEQNIRRAEALSLEVWRRRAACICPHTNTRFFQDAAPDDVWLSGYLEILKKCDVVLATADWEKSSGTRAEIEFAKEHNIPVLFTLSELELWLEN